MNREIRKRKPLSDETKRRIAITRGRNNIKFNCDFCGKECIEKPSHYKRKKKHFCSRKCKSEHIKTLPFFEQNAYKGVRPVGESRQVYHRRYVNKNPENISHLKARRYAREKGAEGSHTLEQWIELKSIHNNRCVECKQDKPLTKDHIIPLSKGGSDYIDNIQPLCKNCNSKKHNKILNY